MLKKFGKIFLICSVACAFCAAAYAKKFVQVGKCETDEKTLVEVCYDENGDLMRGMGIEGKKLNKNDLKYKKYKKYRNKNNAENVSTHTVSKFRRGKRDGLSEEVDDSGFGIKRTYYSKGVKNGTYEEYHKDHSKHIQAFYNDGLLNGRVTYFNIYGKKIGVADYKEGKLVKGYCRDENGKKKKYTAEFIKSHPENELVDCREQGKKD